VAQSSNLPRRLTPTQVMVRFCLRIAILVVFAAFGSIGFGRSLAALLWMSIVLSAIIGTAKREVPFDIALNHWDETVAYAAVFALVRSFDQFVPL
jgi:hypothetical protein